MRVDEILFEARVVLGKAELSFAAYEELQTGDILVLNQKAGMPLSIEIEEQEFFHGHPGLLETHRAIRLT